MSVDVNKLALRIAALETRLGVTAADESKKDEDKAEKKEASDRETLASEIEALEKKINATDAQVTLADVHPRTAADEESDEKKEDAKEDKKEEKKASEVDPNGVEEQITQKSLTEVENLEHGTELATEPTTLDAAPTGYVARLKNASARLDAVAEYLEKTGRTQMALRIDRIADVIDSRVAKITVKS